MPPSIVHKVDEIQQLAKRLTIARSLALCLGTTVLFAIAMAILDFAIKTDDSGLRWLYTSAIAGVGIATFRRWVWPALTSRSSNIDTAVRLERAFPELENLLSSSMAFLDTTQSQDGSSRQLERMVVDKASTLVDTLDLTRAVDRQPTKLALLLAGVVMMGAGVCSVSFPSHALAATSRLLQPWRAMPWPTKHQLRFEDLPASVPKGSDLMLSVIDQNGQLPARIELQIQQVDAKPDQIERRSMNRAGQRMNYELINLTRPVRVRAAGGDDRYMPWQTIDVIDVPQIVDLTVKVVPPEYVAGPTYPLSEPARLLEGSRLLVMGKASKPLRAAEARLTGQAPKAQRRRLAIANDRMSFSLKSDSAPLAISQSGELIFVLTDERGGTNESAGRMRIEVVRDDPPKISMLAAQHGLVAGTDGVVPIELEIVDDVGVDRIELHYQLGNVPSDNQPIEVSIGSQDSTGESQRPAASNWQRKLVHEFDLAEIPGVAAGSEIEMRGRAIDRKGQDGWSQTLRIQVLAESELRGRLRQREQSIGRQLREAADLQRQALEMAGETRREVDDEAIAPSAADSLQLVASRQQQVRQILVDADDSVVRRLETLVAEFTNNRLDSADLHDVARAVLKQIDRADSTSLSVAEQLLRQLTETLPDEAGSDREPLRPKIDRLVAAQEQAVTILEQILAQFSRVEGFHELSRRLAELADRQSALRRQTQLIADLDRFEAGSQRQQSVELSEQQIVLAHSAEKTAVFMERFAGSENAESQVLGVRKALDEFHKHEITRRMRQSAASLRDQRLAAAMKEQAEIESSLSRAYGLMLGASERGTASSAFVDQLAELAMRQESVTADTARWLGQSPQTRRQRIEASRIVEAQQSLARETEQLGTMAAGQAVVEWTLRTASVEMNGASQLLQRNDFSARTVEFQTRASDLLRSILTVWQDSESGFGRETKNGAASSSDLPPESPDGQRRIDFQVLANLQRLILDQTIELRNELSATPAGSERADRLRLLAMQQGQLARLLQQLGESTATDKPNSDVGPTSFRSLP
jgi:hypothetical protein